MRFRFGRSVQFSICLVSLLFFIERVFAQQVQELITNGGFESGSADWTLSGDFYADSRFKNARTGSGYAYISKSNGQSGNNLQATMFQTVNIPANATSVSLTFYYSITSQEVVDIFDDLFVLILDPNNDVLAIVAYLSNLDKDPTPGNYHLSLAGRRLL